MEKLLTTTQLAEAIGASESSMRRWTNNRVIRTTRTAGGHRRILLSEAIRFVRESGTPLVRPELLGLPALPETAKESSGTTGLERALYEALCTSSESAAIACIVGLFLNGVTVATICDGAIQTAMKRIGDLWPQDPRAILVEHRATTICLHALGLVKQLLGEPSADAPVALGCAPDGDPYLLPSLMAATVVAEAGYRDINFGPDTPLELLVPAAREHHAKLVWLAMKVTTDPVKMRSRITELATSLAEMNVRLVLGGSSVKSLGLRPAKNLHILQTMNELAAFASGSH